ncbi:MAG: hypothetical protein ACREUC_18140 [Steroidobacteraceae bacterium]
MRANDTHLHLCFDGQGPPTSIHSADASVHDDDLHAGETHADKDLNPFLGILPKSGDADAEIALPVSVAVLVLLLPPPRQTPSAVFDTVPVAVGSPSHLRPPLRGPPA